LLFCFATSGGRLSGGIRAGVMIQSIGGGRKERTRRVGYPLRFAEEALGHNSKAVHRAYARHAEIRVPCLEDWEQSMQAKTLVVDFTAPAEPPVATEVHCQLAAVKQPA